VKTGSETKGFHDLDVKRMKIINAYSGMKIKQN
jgi:hypothetical protein